MKWTLRSVTTTTLDFQTFRKAKIQQHQAAATEASRPQKPLRWKPRLKLPAEATSQIHRSRTHGVVGKLLRKQCAIGSSYVGLNFAVATPISDQVELIFSGQTGLGDAPERFEATTRFRVGDRHRVGVTASGVRFASSGLDQQTNTINDNLHGQVSLRAVDEWIVRDGIVIVMGLDYSRFIGAGGAHAFTPRFGVQYDANARTRVKAASLRAEMKTAFRVSRRLKTSKWFSAARLFVQSLSSTGKQCSNAVIGSSLELKEFSTTVRTSKRQLSSTRPAGAVSAC